MDSSLQKLEPKHHPDPNSKPGAGGQPLAGWLTLGCPLPYGVTRLPNLLVTWGDCFCF